MNILHKILLFILALPSFAMAQTQINPSTQINWSNPITSLVTLTGGVTANSVNNVYWASSPAMINSIAQTICPSNPIVAINFQAGEIELYQGNYTYTNVIYLPCPLVLDLNGSVLTYNGSGIAVQLGPTGLGSATSHSAPYEVFNGTITGGGSATDGIAAENYVIRPIVHNIKYWNWAGSSSTALFDYLGNQYYAENYYNLSGGIGGSPVGVKVAENANEFIKIDHLNLNNNCSTGVILNGFASTITNSNIEACTGALINIGEEGTNDNVDHVYMEAGGNSGCIVIGDASYLGSILPGIKIAHSYCNDHNSDDSYTGTFVTTKNASLPLRGLTLTDNYAWNSSQSTMVILNNVTNQTGNYGAGNMFNQSVIAATLHNTGSNITDWIGTDGDQENIANPSGTSAAVNVGLLNTTGQGDNTTHLCYPNNTNPCDNYLRGGVTYFGKEVDVPGVQNDVGLQTFNIVLGSSSPGCATSAAAGATCTTSALSLPATEPDTSYHVNCTGIGPTGVPVIIAATHTSGTQFTLTIAALTASAASFGSADCSVGHN